LEQPVLQIDTSIDQRKISNGRHSPTGDRQKAISEARDIKPKKKEKEEQKVPLSDLVLENYFPQKVFVNQKVLMNSKDVFQFLIIGNLRDHCPSKTFEKITAWEPRDSIETREVHYSSMIKKEIKGKETLFIGKFQETQKILTKDVEYDLFLLFHFFLFLFL